jgi:integrase
VKNPNHPPKGSRTRVDPIRDPQDIASIKRLLAVSPRDLLLFTLGVNSGMRMRDLLALKVGEVRHLKAGDSLVLHGARGASSVLLVNNAIHKALKAYFKQIPAEDSHYLFKSRKGDNQPLTIGSVNGLVKSWARAINLSGNFGAHSLRKTFGYIQRVHYGVDLQILAALYNHASPSTTRKYLGIQDKPSSSYILRNDI